MQVGNSGLCEKRIKVDSQHSTVVEDFLNHVLTFLIIKMNLMNGGSVEESDVFQIKQAQVLNLKAVHGTMAKWINLLANKAKKMFHKYIYIIHID